MASRHPRAIISREPAAPERVVAEAIPLDDEELDAAIARATVAAPDWAARAPARAAALERWATSIEADAPALAHLIAREVGKTIREARGEVARAVAIVRYYAQAAYDPIGEVMPGPDAQSELLVRRSPLGVVAAICPWNFPLAIPAWKLAPALAYGNAVVFKPASAAVGVAGRLVALARPDIPDDVLVYAPLPGSRADRLVEDARIAAVSFTGSSDIGRTVVTRVVARGGSAQAEMGGQNASIVLDDADLAGAAATIADAAMGYAGQKCTATRRILVAERVADAFVDAFVGRIESLVIGDPLAEATNVGPVIDKAARDAVATAVAGAARRGARVIAGGDELDVDGWFVRPTVLEIDDPSDEFAQRETFGPAVAILRVRTDDEAVRVANGTRFGLAAAVFGADLGRATAVARRVEAGMIRVNASTTGADFWAPFGGERDSSYGPREQGREAREFFTRTRTVSIYPSRR